LARIDFSVAIQHTPDRADRRSWLKSILTRLRTEEPGIAIEVIEDKTREGCWPTYLRCLEAASTSPASHHLVLQDDLTFCKDFVGCLRKVIQARPKQLIGLFTSSRAVFRARQRGDSWIQESAVAGHAVIWPKELIREFIEWESAHIASVFPWDDLRVSMWLIKKSKPVFATVPSLTQHLGFEASLLGLNSRSKVAAWYVGDKRSGLGIDWSQGLRSPVKVRTQIQMESWRYYRASSASRQTHEEL